MSALSAPGSRATLAVTMLAGGLTTLVVLLVLAGGAPTPPPVGLPDPGPLTGWSLPVVRFGADVTGLFVVGALLVPVLTMAGMGDALGLQGVRAVHSVRRVALVWALLSFLELLLTYSDQFAVPLLDIQHRDVEGFARQVDQGQALVVQAVLALLLAFVSRWILTVRESVGALVLGVVCLLPPLFTGHSAASGSHDTAIVSLVVHVVAVSGWAGGVIALWWFLAQSRRQRELAARRFSSLAAWCFGGTAASGVINALVRLGGLPEFVTSDYGRGALVKLLLLLSLGVVATRTRAVALTHFTADRPRRGRVHGLGTLTAVELGLMAAAVAMGVGLGRTPPPVGEIYTTAAEGLLGGPVPPPPTVARLLWSFTPSGIGLLVVGLGVSGYAIGVWSLHRRGVGWPLPRTLSWVAGLALVGYATAGGLGTYSHVMFSAHMASHMVLSMVAPALLVLGSPVNLALRAPYPVPTYQGDKVPASGWPERSGPAPPGSSRIR